MSTHLSPLGIRTRLGRDTWGVPEEFGPDGWLFRTRSGPMASVIVSVAEHEGSDWVHASIARSDRMPDYADLVHLHEAVFRDGYAYQCFVPDPMHVNIHGQALHLWGRHDGARVLPEFSDTFPGIGRTI